MASQRSVMRAIWAEFGPDRDKVVAEYAAAERRGEASRKSGTDALSPEEYARRLLYNGESVGWLTTDGSRVRASSHKSNDLADGSAALETLVRKAGYPSLLHAVAEHTIFLHPATVAQTQGKPILPVVRSGFRLKRGSIISVDGRKVWADDNGPPTQVFLWSAQQRKGPDLQFNHIWARSQDWRCYTALWNLCVTPAFLAKTTDTTAEVKAALMWRSFELFGQLPADEHLPQKPEGFDELQWAAHPPAIDDLETVLRARIHRAPKSSVAQCVRALGWVFSDFAPESAGDRTEG